jgi:hypothetical protein
VKRGIVDSMDKILYIGGVGSHARQVDAIGDALMAHYGMNVVGMSLRDARRDPALVARLAQGNLVITHSAGMTMLGDTIPREVIAIAPPLPAHAFQLVWRSVLKTIDLYKSRHEAPERGQKIRAYHAGSFVEHVTQPHHTLGHVPKVVPFDAARQAVLLVSRGVSVTLGFMENDRLYPRSSDHHNVEIAKRHGVIVHDDLLGHHDEFVLYPLEVLTQLTR